MRYRWDPAYPMGRRDWQAADTNLRASDDERNAVADKLSRHFAEGRLDQAEFKTRLDVCMAATTRGELDGLFHDLPRLTTELPPPPPRRRRILPLLALVAVFVVVAGAAAARWGRGGRCTTSPSSCSPSSRSCCGADQDTGTTITSGTAKASRAARFGTTEGPGHRRARPGPLFRRRRRRPAPARPLRRAARERARPDRRVRRSHHGPPRTGGAGPGRARALLAHRRGGSRTRLSRWRARRAPVPRRFVVRALVAQPTVLPHRRGGAVTADPPHVDARAFFAVPESHPVLAGRLVTRSATSADRLAQPVLNALRRHHDETTGRRTSGPTVQFGRS